MPNFISLLQSEINNPTEWVFVQRADTRAELEVQKNFSGISTIPKAVETYRRSQGARPRTVSGIAAGTQIVITFQLVTNAKLKAAAKKHTKKATK